MNRWQIRKRDADLQRELQSDLELEEEEQRERGMSPEEARHAAQRAFGNPTLIREQTRAVWSWTMLENLLRDLRISVRTLLRSPGFSIIAVLVIAGVVVFGPKPDKTPPAKAPAAEAPKAPEPSAPAVRGPVVRDLPQ